MRRVEQGERFIVTRNGVAIAHLVPHGELELDRPQRFIPITQIAAGMDELPSWDAAHFADEVEDLDGAIDDGDADGRRTTT